MSRLIDADATKKRMWELFDIVQNEEEKYILCKALDVLCGMPYMTTCWISVKDELPKTSKNVLVVGKNCSRPKDGYYSPETGWNITEWVWDSNVKVTHWMPYPLITKEDSNA